MEPADTDPVAPAFPALMALLRLAPELTELTELAEPPPSGPRPRHVPWARRPPAVWAAARADWEAGDSAPVVAERYGLSDRHVRRRAADEGWVRDGAAVGPFTREPDPEADALRDDPRTRALCAFALRRAVACAAQDRPTEALTWMRLAHAAGRSESAETAEPPSS